ncbi:hypothetical protein [Brevibacillus reuszeri]|uniref:hypothetical protein n=1 Tax=Brevibacillus reuszeri TaxID=54915 RepID=UPI000CCC415C|nr:hypothetical protein [Brevibacillus reuszeri]
MSKDYDNRIVNAIVQGEGLVQVHFADGQVDSLPWSKIEKMTLNETEIEIIKKASEGIPAIIEKLLKSYGDRVYSFNPETDS